MIDKAHLKGRQVAFRIAGSYRVNVGTVKLVEPDGFWIDSPQFANELQQDSAWAVALKDLRTPVFFVPLATLIYLVASQE